MVQRERSGTQSQLYLAAFVRMELYILYFGWKLFHGPQIWEKFHTTRNTQSKTSADYRAKHLYLNISWRILVPDMFCMWPHKVPKPLFRAFSDLLLKARSCNNWNTTCHGYMEPVRINLRRSLWFREVERPAHRHTVEFPLSSSSPLAQPRSSLKCLGAPDIWGRPHWLQSLSFTI